MVTLLTRFDALGPAEGERFVARLEEVRAGIDREPGYVAYRIFRDRDDPTVSFVLEDWRTQEDADRHVAASGEGDAARAALALLVGPPTTVTVIER